jgi:undecaprenyl-diphosphatase
MSILEAIVLGIVQGLTEFLPISSTGHLRVVPALAGWDDPGAAFSAVVQIGTMAAVLLYFRRDLWNILVAWTRGLRDREVRRTADSMLGWYILVGTIPIVVAGVLFEDQIENGARNLWIIGTMLIVLGFVLLAADRLGSKSRDVDNLTWRDGILIGCAQALALIPGVSRSGASMTAGLILGLNRKAAARYSFLLSVPAVVGSGLYQLQDIGGPGGVGVAPTIVATLFAFISGYAAIAFLLRWLTSHPFDIFVAYRVLLGAGVLILVANGTIS